MAKFLISIALLAAIAAGCTTQRTVVLTYNDNVRDTITTTQHYKYNRLNYVQECSCDAVVTKR